MNNFEHLGLTGDILRAVKAEGYENPTPIQAKVIPVMLSGRDIVGIAQTGTGKTAAFVLPMLQQLLDSHSRPLGRTCTALILAPTRELAAQITQSIRTYGQFIHFTTTLIVGGAKHGPQIKALARGVDIVVATPGRLEDHIASGNLRLDQTTTIVLDEADQMMDLGFMPAIRRIMGRIPKTRQTLLLSATMPKQIRALANDFLKNPMEISVAPQARPIEKIHQRIMYVEKQSKRRALSKILDGPEVKRTIVFTRTKRGADGVKTHLERDGFSVTAIHGNRSQRQREAAMASFRGGRVSILVATDVAARGIDVDDISHIVNFELPNVPESYVHRIGRTARAGKGGIAISLCDGSERKLLRDIERLIGRDIQKEQFTAGETPEPKEKPEFYIPAPTLGRQKHQRPFHQQRSNNHQPKAENGDANPNHGKPKSGHWQGQKSQNRNDKPFKHYGKKKGGGGWTGANPKNRNKRKAA